MKITAIKVFRVTLPFRFSFGHSLASRSQSENLVVAAVVDNGVTGYGEGVPRSYVTGETFDGACADVEDGFAPRFIGLDLSDPGSVIKTIGEGFSGLGLTGIRKGAAFCALELALLDALARCHARPLADILGGARRDSVRYGAVVPFGGRKALIAILSFYKLYGFATVKLKVGGDMDEDIERLKLARRILGGDAVLRVDANCAWSPDQAVRAADRMRPFGVASIEEPVAAGDIEGLKRVARAIPEEVVVDESLCTVDEARKLASASACRGFNIRLSKVGGLLAARTIAGIAAEAGINCHMGAQVGESGILSAAGRIFALTERQFANYEGSDNAFLLRRDLTREDLTVRLNGVGKLLPGPGLGITVLPERIAKMASADGDGASAKAPAADSGAREPELNRQ